MRQVNNKRDGKKKAGRPRKFTPEALRSAAEQESLTVKELATNEGVRRLASILVFLTVHTSPALSHYFANCEPSPDPCLLFIHVYDVEGLKVHSVQDPEGHEGGNNQATKAHTPDAC